MPRLPWPLPALLAWGACWAVYAGLLQLGIGPGWALGAASVLGFGMAVAGATWWRSLILALGFPASLAASGAAALPAWTWLLLLALLLLLYPVKAWRDAPLFPTPAGALRDLPASVPLQAGAAVLDAGCGLGHGLMALRAAYPQARMYGLEWSWPLRAACAWRCRWASVRHGDIWRADWSPYAMVYLFQRPESMQRAVDKAERELAPGAWLVSLEFEATTLQAEAALSLSDGRTVWAYRMPFATRAA